MGREKNKEKAAAKDLFVNHLWNAKDIASSFGISETTVGKWKATDPEGDWEIQREKVISNPIKLKQIIQAEMVSIAQGNEPKINADSISKLYKVIEGLSDKIHPGIVAAILKLQDEFLAKECPKLSLQLIEYNKKFLIHIVANYG